MRIFIIFFFLICFVNKMYPQQDYKGQVLNASSKNPIPFVNIGILEKGIGTVSDEEGFFHLPLNNLHIKPTDTLVFSSLGYETKKILVKEADIVYADYPKVELIPTTYNLNEVVVTDKRVLLVPENIGYANLGEEVYGYFKDNIALGGELATKVVVKSGLRRLDKFTFEVVNNPSDSLLIRVNIYNIDRNLRIPLSNLNKSNKNIVKTITRGERMVSVDLKPYSIFVENDFIIAIELLKIYGESDLGLILAAVKDFTQEKFNLENNGWINTIDDGHGSFRRYASQSKWDRFSNLNMAYSLESSLIVDEKKYNRYLKQSEKRRLAKKFLSGFAILNGKMIAGVEVFNHRTKQSVFTNKNGRYKIEGKKGDLISYFKKGFVNKQFKIKNRFIFNIQLSKTD
ncbi:carboxypeptidase-like regulatory domain-containing protein [Croceivirga radicis]|uniref:carboxypeptidase-like regulatory domain-containing protein n=1 Tax=Croceivirga radicis TaxID=1929488 RepID=UPI0009DA2B27|nr:carboxypeptidase-like regulatory domain-containing protein [Croceivirga radicis]